MAEPSGILPNRLMAGGGIPANGSPG